MERIEREIASGRIAIPIPTITTTTTNFINCKTQTHNIITDDISLTRNINHLKMYSTYRQQQQNDIIYSDYDSSTSEDEDDGQHQHELYLNEHDDEQLSQYSNDQSSEAPEWESYIDKNGELIYIDCYPKCIKKLNQPQTTNTSTSDSNTSTSKTNKLFKRGSKTRNSSRRGTNSNSINNTTDSTDKSNNKLLRLIKHTNKHNNTTINNNTTNKSKGANKVKVTFNDCEEGEQRDVHLYVDPKNKIKYGRHVYTISESILGLTLSTFNKTESESDPNDQRIMIAGIIPDSEVALKHRRSIKIGDWLKQINNIQVNINNIQQILDNLQKPQIIKLKLQRIAGTEVTLQPPPNIIPKQSKYLKLINNLNEYTDDDEFITNLLIKLNLYCGLIYINLNNDNDIIYCYPNNNDLTKTYGIYITLQHLFNNNNNTNINNVQYSQIKFNKIKYNIIYTYDQLNLLLFILPDHIYNLQETLQLNCNLINLLKFTFKQLYDTFNNVNYLNTLNHLLSQYFLNILLNKTGLDTDNDDDYHLNINKFINLFNNIQYNKYQYYFDDIFVNMAQQILLPRDLQLDIDDCLNQMESCDYREWNEDPLDCQRLYTIIGSCLYTNKYLLSSHLNHTDLMNINIYLHTNHVFNLFMNETLRTFILWKQVYPKSSLNTNDQYYLLIIGSQHDILCVLFESGGCTLTIQQAESVGDQQQQIGTPDPFYVEEVQYTLNDIQSMGSIQIATKWIHSNLYPQINFKTTNNLLNTTTSLFNKLQLQQLQQQQTILLQQVPVVINDNVATTSTSTSNITLIDEKQQQNTTTATFIRKPYEITSILKRRNNNVQQQQQVITISDNDDNDNDTDTISYQSTEYNTPTAEPTTDKQIIGRREARQRGLYIIDGDDDDYDNVFNDNISDDGASSASSADSTSSNLLLNEIDTMKPYKLVTSDVDLNTLYYYVQLDEFEGIMLCPPSSSHNLPNDQHHDRLLNQFRRSCQIIHQLFKKTVRYKNLLNHNSNDKPIINKSLVAIKEHAILFELNFNKHATTMNKKNTSKNIIKYWVVGRLFSEPHPRELYVCYDESIPQNIVEIAFKLGILEAG